MICTRMPSLAMAWIEPIKTKNESEKNLFKYSLIQKYCKDNNVTKINDVFLNVEEIVKDGGLLFEEHEIVTDDGYILSFWRI